MAKKVGFTDPRLVEDAPITVSSADVERTISESGNDSLDFYSATYRLWKLDLEPHCEDYGQAVIYKPKSCCGGGIERYPSGWLLDKHHFFEAGKIHPVCGKRYLVMSTLLLSIDSLSSWSWVTVLVFLVDLSLTLFSLSLFFFFLQATRTKCYTKHD